MTSSRPHSLPWLLAALAATMTILALISVLVVSTSSDQALFLASITVIQLPRLLLLTAASAAAALLIGLFPSRFTAATLLIVIPLIALFAISHAKRMLDTGHAIYQQNDLLYLTTLPSKPDAPHISWQNQVASLAHVTPALFTNQPVINGSFTPRELRAQLHYSPARSTTLACFFFVTVACLLAWLTAIPVALFRTIRPAHSPALTFLTACPALWTALMVTTLYLLN